MLNLLPLSSAPVLLVAVRVTLAPHAVGLERREGDLGRERCALRPVDGRVVGRAGGEAVDGQPGHEPALRVTPHAHRPGGHPVQMQHPRLSHGALAHGVGVLAHRRHGAGGRTARTRGPCGGRRCRFHLVAHGRFCGRRGWQPAGSQANSGSRGGTKYDHGYAEPKGEVLEFSHLCPPRRAERCPRFYRGHRLRSPAAPRRFESAGMPTRRGCLHPHAVDPSHPPQLTGSPAAGHVPADLASSSFSTAATRRSTSVLSPRPSLLNTELMCFCTARSVRNKALAIVALFLPCAICSSTSRSRGVRVPSSDPAARSLRTTSASTSSGSSAEPPAATCCSDRSSSAMSPMRSLSRYPAPDAPRLRNSYAYCGSANWVRRITPVPRYWVRISAAAASPSVWCSGGIRMSVITTSGRFSSTLASSSSLSAAVATSSTPSRASSRAAVPSRSR